MTKKVAIVCGSPSSEHLAPFDDQSWDIWVLGNRLDRHKGRRISRIFEIHDLEQLSIDHDDAKKYADWLVSHNIPMIVGHDFPVSAEHVKKFPIESASQFFNSPYLTSSSAYMMAQALIEEYEEIGIWGVDMAVDDKEYFYQRPCMEAWIGFAKGMGIELSIFDGSPLLKSHYIEGETKTSIKKDGPFSQDEFEQIASIHLEKVKDIDEKIAHLQSVRQGHDGAYQVYDRLSKVARAVEGGQVISSLKDSFALR